MIRLGILDFDTSHVVEFTKRINHIDIAKEQWVEGAKIVIGCPGESKLSPERIPGYTEQMKKYGVPLVDKPTDMIGKVDGMLIEAVDGSVHWERAKPFLEAGIPCYVDKPFTCSVADAKAMIALSEKKKLPLFTSSSLRYAAELVEYMADTKHGKIQGCTVHGPASLHERNPGLFHYGIHAVEMLYTIMGPGCKRVTCTHDTGTDVATGHWQDGRIATVRGIRAGSAGYGFTAYADKGITAKNVTTGVIYRELIKKIVEMFTTKTAPIDVNISLEIVAFIEAALKSSNNHGAVETLKM